MLSLFLFEWATINFNAMSNYHFILYLQGTPFNFNDITAKSS